ncbi:MAG: 8-amino-7-oxononanoate synthase [Polyangia bacterium]
MIPKAALTIGAVKVRPLESIQAELDQLTANGLRRRMRAVDGPNSAELLVDGRSVVNFSSNNYLGLANHPAIVTAVRSATAEGGFGSAGSRMISGSVSSHRQLEHELAAWLGVDRALLFNSGYQANLGVVSALARPGDAVFSDALNHASLIDGCRLSRASVHIYAHGDLDNLKALLEHSAAPRKLVLTESLFSMDGDIARLSELATICRAAGALLVVDEAHAVGALGPMGVGLATDADLVIGTFGKSFGGFGAYVAGPEAAVELISQRARSFIFSTALPGLISAGTLAALHIVMGAEGDARRTVLASRCSELGRGLERLGLGIGSGTHIQPLLLRDPDPLAVMRISELLLQRGLFVQGIRPPTVPRGTSRLRVSLMATHTSEQLDALIDALGSLRDHLRPA